jgi:hypothetical protein
MSTTPSGILTATDVRNALNVTNSAGGTTNYPTNTISFNDSLVRKLVNTSGTTSPVVDSSLQLWLDAGNTSSYSSGSTWNDLSGKGNHGTLTNSPTYIPGTSGYFSFGSGASQYVSFTYKTPIQSASTAFTWSIWVYPTQNQDSYVLMGYRGSILQFYKLTTQKFEMYPAEVFYQFTLNVWQNICVVYDGTQSGGGNMKMYVNANGVGLRDADQPSLSSSVMPFYIGGDPFAGEYATARISQVMIYNRALTPAEVSQNYNALRTRYAGISMNDMRNKAGPNAYGTAADAGACGIVSSSTFSQNFNNGTYGTYRVDTLNSPNCLTSYILLNSRVNAPNPPYIVYSVNGSTITPLSYQPNVTKGSYVGYTEGSISPDGKYIITNYGMQVFRKDSEVWTEITSTCGIQNPGNFVQWVSWTRDGNYVVLAGGYPNACYLYRNNRNDTFTKLSNPTVSNDTNKVAQWSPDGNYLLLGSSNVPGSVQTYMYKRSGDSLSELTFRSLISFTYNGLYYASWSSDSIYIALANYSSPFLYVFKRSGDSFTRLSLPSISITYGWFCKFSPNNTYLAFGGNNPTPPGNNCFKMFKRSGDTFTQISVPDITSYNISDGAWSSDSQYLYLSGGRGIWVFQRSGDTFTQVNNIMPNGGSSYGLVLWESGVGSSR